MKVKQKSVCQTCRTRKLGCDGKRPGCSQCVLSGRFCDGYSTNWTFVSQDDGLPKAKEQHSKWVQQYSKSHLHSPDDVMEHSQYANDSVSLLPSLRPDNNDFMGLIIQNYIPGDQLMITDGITDDKGSRICGSWIEVLPVLENQSARDPVLPTAIKALAGSIGSQKQEANQSILSCSQPYQVAIRALRKSFARPDHTFRTDLIAAAMCLTLVELMLPESLPALTAHVKGVGLLLLTYGPEACKSGALHKLFVGFRPLLVLEAFRHRQPVFLASPEWFEIPFFILSPSLMQRLLSKAVIIPSLFRKCDEILDTPCASDISEIRGICRSFIDIVRQLEDWETSTRVEIGRPYFWNQDKTFSSRSPPTFEESFLWYDNVTMANVFTHLWAFHIVCLSEIERLMLLFPETLLGETSLLSLKDVGDITSRTLTLSKQICLSMEYLMQDEMKLFGPASTFFPLQVANEKLRAYGPANQEYVDYIEQLVGRLVRKGLRSAPILVPTGRT
ncbi:hypothetical protein P170DRAFT_352165 [Aspergillus steynii IBT 23096]|uniref:Zn(2)-C6 fungal-type domain-containing protein n=1 Tax=Aspergillus steynii IBT 23096 TaxID=1392250 RepID=A0A2I2GGP9_9EURO|nr:uncharacterized protein P170DRAFT_352165 [Aspergillus steynii IBT 23096]PLB52007.1 hypothetical protein P170DRAFT_352165 [Aspergillus steynii IBT 23096]